MNPILLCSQMSCSCSFLLSLVAQFMHYYVFAFQLLTTFVPFAHAEPGKCLASSPPESCSALNSKQYRKTGNLGLGQPCPLTHKSFFYLLVSNAAQLTTSLVLQMFLPWYTSGGLRSPPGLHA